MILDVGCGFSGSHAIWKRDLSTHGMTNVEIVGIDINPNILTKDAIHGDGCKLPIKNQSVDVVVVEFVLMHLDVLAPKLGLSLRREVRRVLKKGGLFAHIC